MTLSVKQFSILAQAKGKNLAIETRVVGSRGIWSDTDYAFCEKQMKNINYEFRIKPSITMREAIKYLKEGRKVIYRSLFDTEFKEIYSEEDLLKIANLQKIIYLKGK